jgi:hypothetical protein
MLLSFFVLQENDPIRSDQQRRNECQWILVAGLVPLDRVIPLPILYGIALII